MSNRHRGFTLLELLLVVGIAAVLIASATAIYVLVSKQNRANETVRLTLTVITEVRRMYRNQPTYGTPHQPLEPALYYSGGVPSKFKGVSPGQLTTPYASDNLAINVVAYNVPGLFLIQLKVPPASVWDVAKHFIPDDPAFLYGVFVCNDLGTYGEYGSGWRSREAFTPATVAENCGGSTATPAEMNVSIIAR